MHITSTSKLVLKPVYEPSGAKSQERRTTRNTTQKVQEEGIKTITKQPQNTPSFSQSVTGDIQKEKTPLISNIPTKTSPEGTSSNNETEKSPSQSNTPSSHTQVDPRESGKALQKKQTSVKDQGTTKPNDPPWKNISLRRTESARVTNYGREKPLTWKRDATEKSVKTVPMIVVENTDSTTDKPTGWRPVVMETGTEKKTVNLRRCESARVENKNNIDVIAKFLSSSQSKEKRDLNDNKITSIETPPRDNAVTKLNSESAGLNRSQSMRMLFENMEAKKNQSPAPAAVVVVQRRDQGLRRTSSLKVLPGEMESFRAEHKARVSVCYQLGQGGILTPYLSVLSLGHSGKV